MVALARKTLLHEWRRFLPATIAVGFSGVLLVVQSALVLGIFSSASVHVGASSADLWIGYPDTQSVELGQPIPDVAELRARLDPEVTRVERFQWLDGNWRGASTDRGAISVVVTGIDARSGGLLFDTVLSHNLRARLLEPGAFIVDEADRAKLSASGEINGHRVTLIGTSRGVRSLGNVNVITSAETARTLGAPGPQARTMTYLLVKLRHPELAQLVRTRLQDRETPHRYAVWTREEFGHRAIVFWLTDTGAGLGLLFGAALVIVIGIVITSQTLMSAIAGSLRELATLRALGVSANDLSGVVLEQATWIGGAGLLAATTISATIIAIAKWQHVPVAITASIGAACATLVMLVALASGAMAARALRAADPALLLR